MSSYNTSISTSPFPFMVLLYDLDSTHLSSIENTLLHFGYQVTKFQRPNAAILALETNQYDIVICTILMSDVDGLRLVRIAGLKFNLPVVLITSDDSSEEIAFKGILMGACECLAKPVQPETLKHIWQYVVSKRRGDFLSLASAHIQNSVQISAAADDVVAKELSFSAGCGGETNSSNPNALRKKRKEVEEEEESTKKARFIWTEEPHQIFLDAVRSLTLEKAVPKKILGYMKNHGVRNITRAIVASHLQKYRLYVRKNQRKLENNEGEASSKLLSFQSISLNLTKDSHSTSCPPCIHEETPLEAYKSEVLCSTKHRRPQYEPSEQTLLDEQNMLILNEHIRPPNVSNNYPLYNVVDGSNGKNYQTLNDCPIYSNILKGYEDQKHVSQSLENIEVYYGQMMHLSNNRNHFHSIAKDHFVNCMGVNAKSNYTQDELKQVGEINYYPPR